MRWIPLLVSLFLPWFARAQNENNPLEVHLISEVRSISAGATFHLGLQLRHPAGSHSYWKHPGIVGLATTVKWEMPPGFSAGEIQWPAPSVVKMACYDTQGYEGETLLLIPITAPKKFTANQATLTAKVSWMCCGKVCNPAADVPFSVTLPVTDAMESDPSTQPVFAKFRALVPRSDPDWKASAKHEQDRIILKLKPTGPSAAVSNPTGIRFFTADGQVNSNEKQAVELLSDGSIQMILSLAEIAPKNPTSLPGVVTFPAGWQSSGNPFHLEINPEY